MAISKRGILIGSTVIGSTVLLTAAVGIAGADIYRTISQAVPGAPSLRESPKELIDEVWQVINNEYVDPKFNGKDWQDIRRQYLARNYATQEDAYKAAREMLELLGDPYTRFMDPAQYRSMQIETQGELTGVGIQIAQDEKSKEIKVISPIEDSPASKAGLMSQDVLVRIDDKSTKGMDVNQAVGLIRGPANTPVTLTVRRNGQELSFKLVRAKIEIHPVRASIKQTPDGPVGYIRLNQFSQNAAPEMRAAIRDLESKNVRGYILDLRGNPGGLLFSSVEIARMFLNTGRIVSTVNRGGDNDPLTARGNNLTNKPLVVLIDGGSASASEILSGALRDNRRAVLVGTRTFGKGLVQSVQPLGDGSGIAVTISKYFTPNGTDINKKGIEPDVEVKLSEEQQKKITRETLATDVDPQYVRALTELIQQIASQSPRQSQLPAPASP
jgi:carboxyl-terminal processing protease